MKPLIYLSLILVIILGIIKYYNVDESNKNTSMEQEMVHEKIIIPEKERIETAPEEAPVLRNKSVKRKNVHKKIRKNPVITKRKITKKPVRKTKPEIKKIAHNQTKKKPETKSDRKKNTDIEKSTIKANTDKKEISSNTIKNKTTDRPIKKETPEKEKISKTTDNKIEKKNEVKPVKNKITDNKIKNPEVNPDDKKNASSKINKNNEIKPAKTKIRVKNINYPVPGNNGKITIMNVSYNSSVIITWDKGKDDITPEKKLKYKIYYSNYEEIDTMELIEDIGVPMTGWMTDTYFYMQRNLSIEKQYYFNIIIMDENLNKSLYAGAEQEALFVQIRNNIEYDPFLLGFDNISILTQEVYFTYNYFVSKFEVTFNEYDYFCIETGRKFADDVKWGRGQRPVIFVSWHDAISYCNWLSERVGLPAAYNKKGELVNIDGDPTNEIENVMGYRLLTEAEWEFAASNRGKRSGNQYSGGNFSDSLVWSTSNSQNKTHLVGSKNSNELNIFDMSGNVFEWCYDWFKDYQAGFKATNPIGPDNGKYKILRGGSWYLKPEYSKISRRDSDTPNIKNFNIGFRICKTEIK